MHNAHLRYTYSLIHGLQVCSRCKRSRWYVCPYPSPKRKRPEYRFHSKYHGSGCFQLCTSRNIRRAHGAASINYMGKNQTQLVKWNCSQFISLTFSFFVDTRNENSGHKLVELPSSTYHRSSHISTSYIQMAFRIIASTFTCMRKSPPK